MKLCDVDSYANLPPECADVVGSSIPDSFFNLPGWYDLVAQHGVPAGNRYAYAVADQAPIAAACYFSTRHELCSCTNLYSCEFDLLGERSNLPAVRTFAQDLVSSVRPLDAIRFEGLDPGTARFAALADGLRAAGYFVRPYFGWGVWFERTQGTNFNAYLLARPSILQNTWRRKHARFEKAGGRIRSSYTGDDNPESFSTLYEKVRETSWKNAEPFREFIPELIRFAARSRALRFGILEIGGVPAAAQFWIVWAGRATIFKLVHAEAYSAFSPGTLLTMHMIQKALEIDRPDEIDFGRGDDGYKKLWFSARRERWGIEGANARSSRGLALCARMRAGEVRQKLKGALSGFRRDYHRVPAN